MTPSHAGATPPPDPAVDSSPGLPTHSRHTRESIRLDAHAAMRARARTRYVRAGVSLALVLGATLASYLSLRSTTAPLSLPHSAANHAATHAANHGANHESTHAAKPASALAPTPTSTHAFAHPAPSHSLAPNASLSTQQHTEPREGASRSPTVEIINDDQLMALLAAAGKPSGIIRVGGPNPTVIVEGFAPTYP
jgi:hypothetical protein